MFYSLQDKDGALTKQQVSALLDRHMADNDWHSVLLMPPDITRSHSGSGFIAAWYYEHLTARGCKVKVMPALGTHVPMTREELESMFGPGIPQDAYITHNFKTDIEEVGVVPGAYMDKISEGLFTEDVHVAINRELLSGKYDAILSIGQVIPHEIAGFASYTKNIVVGAGGGEMINVSHFLGVFWGLDRILGTDKTPVRLMFDYVQDNLLKNIPFTFIQTVMAQIDGEDCYKGLFISTDRRAYEAGVALSRQVNFNLLDRPARKCVVWMDPHSYHSTWVTNKAIYRTQLAVEPGGEIVIIAPGVHMFGENDIADSIIRKYGYLSRERALELRKTEETLQKNLSITGHLIHGVPEGIKVTYCTDKLSHEEMLSVNMNHMSVDEALAAYPCRGWENGWHTLPSGEEIYFVANAALGLWRYDGNK